MSRAIFSPPFQLLELNVISGQDLAQLSRKMRTYAVAWVHPDRKLATRVDIQGHNNPTWNDKFVFRVDDEFLYGDTSAIMIEIFALHWFRDIHVGTVRVLVGNLVPPPQFKRQHHVQLGTMRFVALQVRRRSGRPQGILNIGVSLLDTSMRSMPLYSQISASAVGYRHLMGEKDNHAHNNNNNKEDDRSSDDHNQFLLPWIPKPELRRTKSESSSMFGSDMVGKNIVKKTQEQGSSMVNGSDIIDKDNNNFKKLSSKASSMITGSEIFKKLIKKTTDYPHNDPAAIGTLTKTKYGSDISGGRITPPPNKSPTTANMNSLHNLQVGTPKQMNNRAFLHLITDSELGPSASEVAAVMIKNKNQHRIEETESEVMGSWSLESSMEGLQSKLERWRAELPPVYDRSELSSYPISSVAAGRRARHSHNRRHSVGEGGFSCFGTFCGVECSIVCGGSGSGSSNRKKRIGVKRSPSAGSFSFL